MVTYGLESRELARAAGVSPQMMSMIISGRRAPRERIERLVQAGVPRELLPDPREGKRSSSSSIA
ncbi:helix-turn-helix domain-containing protein [Desulfovibrio ferrophilus]|nr:helix-turn-helix transcriptional regulator [Desulfovibrio ferrophilus]